MINLSSQRDDFGGISSADFEKWIAVLKKKNRKNFSLYGKEAALIWNDAEWIKDDYEVLVVCIINMSMVNQHQKAYMIILRLILVVGYGQILNQKVVWNKYWKLC